MTEPVRRNGYYNYDGFNFPSVSTITKFVGENEGLIRWACELGGQGVLWALKNATNAQFEEIIASPTVMNWSKEKAIEGLQREQERVTGFGKVVHHGIECRLKNVDLNLGDWTDAEKIALETFEKFYAEVGFDPILVEAAIYSPKYRYAGRLDLLANISQEQAEKIKPYLIRTSELIVAGKVLADFKTGSFYHKPHGIQIAAYAQAATIEPNPIATRTSSAIAAAFDATLKKALTSAVAPSNTSGHQK